MALSDLPVTGRPLNTILEKINSRWRGFPNITTLGSYDHMSQVIRLNALEKRDIDQLTSIGTVDIKKKILPLMAHEGTHYLDHVATLWGQFNLVDIYNALHSRIQNNEHQFWRISDFKTKLKRIHYADYYNIILEAGKQPWDGKPWQQTMTMGFEFGPDGRINNNRPILFLRFSTEDERPVARVPLSIVSLLETTAMAAEIDLELKITNELSGDQLVLERKFVDKKYTNRLFDGNLCVYSVCAHLLANKCMIFNYVDAYRKAARLAMLCLNIPRKAFARIKLPPHLFNGISGIISYFRRTCDRALAYYILLTHAPILFEDDPDIWLKELVKSSGLGTLEQLQREGDEELSGKKDLLTGIETDRLQELLRTGTVLRKHRDCYTVSYFDVWDRAIIHGDVVSGPAVLLGDDHVISFGNPPTESLSSSEDMISWIYRIYDYESRMDEFLGACLM